MNKNFVSSSNFFILFCANNINRFYWIIRFIKPEMKQRIPFDQSYTELAVEKCILLDGIYAKAMSLLAAYNLVSTFS